MIEDGHDPSCPANPLPARAHHRLTTTRAQETAQHVLMRAMREDNMKTSGLAERLRAAQDAPRESVGRTRGRGDSG
ncbi:hypothetical protein [Streptomyces zhihengii]|uniref:hypothetical protein n=1 Tax=Streptomyces zhihengii TaxID=1818004 RepID=UPI001FD512BC|nr:hypothetical protein [Streptomyces zhihengii]